MTEDDYANEGHAAPRPQVVSSTRIVYCTNCGCQLDGLHIGEPCPNCATPVGTAGPRTGKGSGKAVASMVLGICSIVGCMFYGLPGLVCGILAIYFARGATRDVESGATDQSAMGMVSAGRICGIVGVSLSALAVVVMIAYFIFIFAVLMPQMQQQQQQNTPTWQTQPAPTQPSQPSFP